jgi:hypothetical protein
MRAAPDGPAPDQRGAHACAGDERAVSAHLCDSAVRDHDHHADACAGGRHAHLLVFGVHQLCRTGGQRGHAQPAAALGHPARLHPQSGPAQPLGLQPRRASGTHLLWAWAKTTSMCTTSGPAKAWARSRTAPASTWAPATRSSWPTAASCSKPSRRCRPGACRPALHKTPWPASASAPTRWTALPPAAMAAMVARGLRGQTQRRPVGCRPARPCATPADTSAA